MEIYSSLAKCNPPWTDEEERDAIKKWFKTDHDRFVEEATKHNLALCFKLMGRYAFKKNDEDIMQAAVVAMSNAIKKFKPRKKCKISTWIHTPIKWAILQAQHTYSHNGSIQDELTSLNYRYKLGLSVVSIDMEIGNRDDGDAEALGNLISTKNVHPDYAATRGYKTLKEINHERDIHNGVKSLLSNIEDILTIREAFIIKELLTGKNQSDIADMLNLSRMRISQLTASAFAKIRNSPIAKKLKETLK